jgi:hydrogenase-4 component B
MVTMQSGNAGALLSVIAGLALIGGLATACFTKAFGIVFLGEPRSEAPLHARESEGSMLAPMVILAGGCFAVGLLGFQLIRIMPVVLTSLIPAWIQRDGQQTIQADVPGFGYLKPSPWLLISWRL